MARTNKDRWFLIGPAAFFVAGLFWAACQTENKPLMTPKPPEEILEAKFIYPENPIILDFAKFKQSLNQLSRQLTVLSLIGPGKASLREGFGNIPILRDVQKHFFRYGVQVLLVNLQSPAGWAEVKKNLQQVNANFPAVYYPSFQARFLKSFLQTPALEGYHLFIIDDGQVLKIPSGESADGPRFKERIKQILQKRGTPEPCSR